MYRRLECAPRIITINCCTRLFEQQNISATLESEICLMVAKDYFNGAFCRPMTYDLRIRYTPKEIFFLALEGNYDVLFTCSLISKGSFYPGHNEGYFGGPFSYSLYHVC